jgi:hypothetical protein
VGADVVGELRVGGATEDNNVAHHVCCVCECCVESKLEIRFSGRVAVSLEVGWWIGALTFGQRLPEGVSGLGRELRDNRKPGSGGGRCQCRVGVCSGLSVYLKVWHGEGQGYKGSPEIVAPGKSGHLHCGPCERGE